MTTKTADAAIEKVRPLSLGASRNLQKLIENDFSALREQLGQYAADLLEQAETKIRKKWAAKGLDVNAYVDRMTALHRKLEDDQQALIREAREAGIQLEKSYGRNWTADAYGLKEAIAAEQKTIRKNQTRAESEMKIQHKSAERRVLLATVTGEAVDLLASLPTAAQLMAAANKSLTS